MRVAQTLLALVANAAAHIVLTYPGTRGHNLVTNETFPYGMQFEYPCGGLNVTTNRTYWPIEGGAVALEPGWQAGHSEGSIHINLGIGDEGPDGGPRNTSFRMTSEIPFTGPSNDQYDATICLERLQIPDGLDVSVGDNATIQVVEHTQHGASLYACVDIEFVESDDDRIKSVNDDNCFNSTNIEFGDEEEETDGASDDSDGEDNSDGEGNLAARQQAVGLMSIAICLLMSLAMLG